MTENANESVYPHNVDNHARIYEDAQGHLWVTHEELLLCGYVNISDFDVVYLNGKFYELQAHSRKGEAWWIEQIETPELPESESASV